MVPIKVIKLYLIKEEITMAYHITDACINCGACVSECPVDAISEGAEFHAINADACIDCGACAGVCPVDAPQA